MADGDRFLVIETDTMTGWKRRKGRAVSRPEADDSAAQWRKVSDGRYRFDIEPVVAWLLDITKGDHHDLFMMAMGSGLVETDLASHDVPTVWLKEGEPGGQVWAYTRKGATSPPEWLVKLCEIFEAAGYEAGIRRPGNA